MFTNNLNVLHPKKTLHYTYSQIILWGYNYSFRGLRRRRLLLNLQYANHFEFRIPTAFVTHIYKKRLVLYGEKLSLLAFIKELVDLKNPNKYTGKGLRTRTLKYQCKPSAKSRKTR